MWVKDLVFGKADERHVDAFLELIDERIEWMNAVGIDQWNNNHYHERYPKEYFLDVARSGKMYMLSNKDDGKMVAGAVLFEEDKRWGKMSSSAYYLHNLAASLREKNSGRRLVEEIERLSRLHGKEFLRLDCICGNEALNAWYESMGFKFVGRCTDGEYRGNLREKKL